MAARFGKEWSKEIDFAMVTHFKNAFYAGASTTINAVRTQVGRASFVRLENEIITDIQDYAGLMEKRQAAVAEEQEG